MEECVQRAFNTSDAGTAPTKKVSLADLIVLGGNAAVEEAARRAGVTITIPFTPGRTDATEAQTDVAAFENLKVSSDGFRNYYNRAESYLDPARAFVDRADLLTLTVPEVVVLTGGLRVLGANHGGSAHGVFTQQPETLTNDFFVALMDRALPWTLTSPDSGVFTGTDRGTGVKKWTATTHDLILGSSADLRVVSFTYATPLARTRFAFDFAKAWAKVMSLDRFDLARR